MLFISATALGTRRDCPPWFKWVNTSSSSGYCICASEVIGPIECDQLNQKSYLRLAGCVFYDSDKDEVVAARCPFLPPNSSFNQISSSKQCERSKQICVWNLSSRSKRSYLWEMYWKYRTINILCRQSMCSL